jgi:hypothetical protein
MTNNSPQYWVVGASWGGVDHKTDYFIDRGIWYIGWKDNEQPNQIKLRNKIKVNDRIAIKKMLGQGSDQIMIRALGVVIGLDDLHDDRPENSGFRHVYVDWKVRDLDRKVYCNGCLRTIHGPFKFEDEWTREVFCI